MSNLLKSFLFPLFLIQVTTSLFAQKQIKHFIFFSRNREKIHEDKFYSNPGVIGAQVTYPWRILEPEKDRYDFREIEEDLTFLASKDKKLFIQIQDVTFDSIYVAVPKYLLADKKYNGGQASQFEFVNDDESKAKNAGWVSRRWDTAVATRYHKLLIELGKRFDGRIEGINLPESSVDFGSSGRWHPSGFTYEIYRDAIKANMKILRIAFPKSVCIQYANFMPGDFGAFEKNFLLKSLYDYGKEIGVGMGGPDIKVNAPFQMINSYALIHNSGDSIITGVAVQDGNYGYVNPKTHQQVTIAEILDFATNYLRLNYIFWCTEEPFYSKQVLPFLSRVK